MIGRRVREEKECGRRDGGIRECPGYVGGNWGMYQTSVRLMDANRKKHNAIECVEGVSGGRNR